MHISRILHIKPFVSAKDGDQLVDFYWIDPMLVAERIAAKSKYAGNLYLQFELEDSWERPGTRAFGRVNGGLVFEAAYLFDKNSVPLLSVFYADKSFLKGMSHHPIYRKCIFCIFCILHIYCILHVYKIFVLSCNFSESLLNIKEDFRSKPTSWYAVGWMPIIDEDKSHRPGQGYDSDSARNLRVHHECLRHFLRPFIQKNNARVILYGDGKARQTRHTIGAFLGDQQVLHILNIQHIHDL